MKAVLKFDLSYEDDRTEFEFALKGKDACLALLEFSKYLRNLDKYDIETSVEEIRKRFNEDYSYLFENIP